VKSETYTELGKLSLNGVLAVFVTTIAQPIVTHQFDWQITTGGILTAAVLLVLGILFLEKGGRP
jgi:hypothetical protein